MAEMITLRDALLDEVKDLYSAEKQLVKTLPKLAKHATSEELRDAITEHFGQTRQHVARLEQVFDLLDERARAKTCAGMQGIIEEGSETLEQGGSEAVGDARIIASAQRAEHYEIAAYGTIAAWAEGLGLSDVAALLRETLAEEKAADEKLTSLAEAGINAAAGAGEPSDEEQAQTARSSRARSSSAGATSRAAAAHRTRRRRMSNRSAPAGRSRAARASSRRKR